MVSAATSNGAGYGQRELYCSSAEFRAQFRVSLLSVGFG
jgi:hypothetical protein